MTLIILHAQPSTLQNPHSGEDPMTPPAAPPVLQTANLMLDAKLTLNQALEEIEKALIAAALERTRGNICHAALTLEVHRNTLSRRLQALQLKELPAKIRWEARHKLWARLPKFKPVSDSAIRMPSQAA